MGMALLYKSTTPCQGPLQLRPHNAAAITSKVHLARSAFYRPADRYSDIKKHRLIFAAASSTDLGSNGTLATNGRAAKVIAEFYQRYNSGDVDGVMDLMAEGVSYHDLALYQEPFEGKAAVRAYFEKVKPAGKDAASDRMALAHHSGVAHTQHGSPNDYAIQLTPLLQQVTSIVPPDLKFTFENCAGDDRAVGIRWHVELEGREFPFSRGVSFYELDENGLISSARDLVESATKPGGAALYALKVLAPVVRRLGPKADPGALPPTSGLIMWSFYAAYVAHILVGTAAPGRAAWQQTPEALATVLNESINFFYVNIWLNLIPAAASHPVSEAQFNFVVAWGLMLGVFIFADKKAEKVSNKWQYFLGNAFITNLVFIPWLALRECQREAPSPGQAALKLPVWAPATAAISLGVGVLSLWWAAAARPEYGGLPERWQYYLSTVASDRIFYAFAVDALLYSVWQAALMPKETGTLRFIPFFGLAAYLLGVNRKTP